METINMDELTQSIESNVKEVMDWLYGYECLKHLEEREIKLIRDGIKRAIFNSIDSFNKHNNSIVYDIRRKLG